MLHLTRCGAESSSDNITHIWVVTHTHDDVGWLNTVDRYYVDSVQWILDTGIQCIADSPCYGTERRYSYVEMAYLYRWWNERPEPIRERLRSAIRDGRFELNLAGWCMNDEAVTFYNDEIDQMTEGALFVKDQIGDFAYPTVGWHIDPFGHSSATASLWADIGFDAFGLNRINFEEKEIRRDRQELEFVWRSSKSRGREADIFVHILAEAYQTPPECSVDHDAPDPQNDPTLPTDPTNMIATGESFVKAANIRKPYFRHNHVLIPFGDDFAHTNAYHSFQQMDKIIEYVNSNSSLNATARYGTFSEYIRTLNSLNITWPTYEGDFFPYLSGDLQYWTGFYTSRPDIKGLVRSSSAVLRVAEILYYSAEKLHPGKLGKSALEQLGILRRAMATLQHHDAVTGTERAAVAADYVVQLEQGLNSTKLLISSALDAIRSKLDGSRGSVHDERDTADTGRVLTLYNSLSWHVDTVVSVPISSTKYTVMSETGEPLRDQQIIPNPDYSPKINVSKYSLYFRPGPVPPLGYRMVHLQPTEKEEVPVTNPKAAVGDRVFSVSSNFYTLSVNGSTGELSSLSADGHSISFNHELSQYTGAALQGETIHSGAYIFRPQQANRVLFVPQLMQRVGVQSWSFLEEVDKSGLPDTPWPIVLVSAHAPNLALLQSAAYGVTSIKTAVNGTTLVLCRVDGLGWREFMASDYLVLENRGPMSLVEEGWQYGATEVMSLNKQNCSTVEVRFKSEFLAAPMVFASVECRGESKFGSFFGAAFTVTMIGVETSYARFNVCSTDHYGWEGQVYVNWLALRGNTKLSDTQIMGTTNQIVGPSLGAVSQVNIAFPDTYPVYEPSVILTVHSASGRSFTASAALVTRDGFIANVCPTDNVAGDWSKDGVRLSWFAFEQPDIQHPVTAAPPAVEVVDGPLVTEIRQFYRKNYATTTRLYHGESVDLQVVEQEYDIGILDPGKELVTRFKTSLLTDSCYTDDNGLEMIKRTYTHLIQEPVAGNYYPMVKAAEIRDESSDLRLAVLSDRSHGLGCMGNGEFEIMLQRRTLTDDDCGLNEPLNDLTPIEPRFWILLGKAAETAPLRQRMSLLLQYPIHVVYDQHAGPLHEFSLLDKSFPEGIHLLSLKARNTTQQPSPFVFRVQNLWEAEDQVDHPNVLTVSLGETFSNNTCPLVGDEMNLTANRLKASVKRLTWKTNDTDSATSAENIVRGKSDGKVSSTNGVINLTTRQIRTFIVT